jgi:trimethylamine--corrinoid protein Co-methyltransferase
MVLVNEILYMVEQFMGGVPVNDETLALDVMDKVGPGGHYLYEDHTLKHFKGVWTSDLFDRSIHEMWLSQGARRFEQRSREETERFMQHQPAPLPDDVLQELERMAGHWE